MDVPGYLDIHDQACNHCQGLMQDACGDKHQDEGLGNPGV